MVKKGIIALTTIVALLGMLILLDYERPPEADEEDIQIWYPSGYELLLKKDLNEVEILKQLEDDFAVPLFFYCVNGDIDSQFQAVLAAWGRNDAVFYRFSAEQLKSSYENGQILDYTEYLEQMPHLKELCQRYPELQSMACVDGKYLRFPAIMWNCYDDRMLAVRTDWMDQAGVEKLESLDELKDLLICQRDLFRQGKLINQGEYFAGLSSYGGHIEVFQMLFHTDQGLYWNDNKTELRFGPETEEYRQYLIYMQQLYQNKVLDAHLYEPDSMNFEKYFLNNQTPVMLAPVEQEGKLREYSVTTGDNIDIVYINPCTFQEGAPTIYSRKMRSMQVLDFGFVIREGLEPEKLEKLLALIDYLYSPEGIELLNWGNPGEHFVEDFRGRRVYSPELLNEKEYYMVDMSQYVKQDLLCTDKNANRWMLSEEQQACVDEFSYERDLSFISPDGYYTKEERETLRELESSLTTYVEELTMKFIYEELDPADDAVWREYTQALEQMGVSMYKEIQENAYWRMQEEVN